ncbi:hypothetical protein C2E23DRAFT_704507, partial [Lenzites betulinus]
MWIKTYLNLQRSRPRWTFLADALFAGAPTLASKRVARSVRVNPFLQQWDVSVRPMRPLPAPLRTMISTATRFNTSLSPLLPDEALRLALPIWYHIGMRGGRAAANSAAGRCLRERHLVKTVADCVRVVARLQSNDAGGPPHILNLRCVCTACECDRRLAGCENPHRCVTAAARALARLAPLWNPHALTNEDGLSPHRRTRHVWHEPDTDEAGAYIFDPSIRSGASVHDGFRVFGSQPNDRRPPLRAPPRPFEVPPEEVMVYTDGSCAANGGTTATAGAGVWYGAGDPRNIAARVPGEVATNQRAELYAVALAVDATPPFARLNVVSD